MKLVITFVGLICQVTMGSGPSEQHFAALVRDDSTDGHQQVLKVDEDDLVSSKTDPKTFPLAAVQEAGKVSFNIHDMKISVKPVAAVTLLTDDFNDDVIGLTESSNATTLAQDVTEKLHSGNSAATTIVELEGGMLDVDTDWPYCSHVGKSKDVCVARSTKYVVQPSADVTITSDDGRSITVGKNAEIEISNKPPHAPVIVDPLKHWKKYIKLTNATKIDNPKQNDAVSCTSNKVKPRETDADAAHPHLTRKKKSSTGKLATTERVIAGVECSNSAFP